MLSWGLWQHLETILVGTEVDTGIQWVEMRDATKYSTEHRTDPHQKEMPLVPRWRSSLLCQLGSGRMTVCLMVF